MEGPVTFVICPGTPRMLPCLGQRLQHTCNSQCPSSVLQQWNRCGPPSRCRAEKPILRTANLPLDTTSAAMVAMFAPPPVAAATCTGFTVSSCRRVTGTPVAVPRLVTSKRAMVELKCSRALGPLGSSARPRLGPLPHKTRAKPKFLPCQPQPCPSLSRGQRSTLEATVMWPPDLFQPAFAPENLAIGPLMKGSSPWNPPFSGAECSTSRGYFLFRAVFVELPV